MDKKQIENKMKTTRNLNLASLIVAWVVLVVTVVLTIAVLKTVNINYDSGDITYTNPGLATFAEIAGYPLRGAVLVLAIIAAVFNNNREIKKIYIAEKRGTAAPVLSILAAVFSLFGIGFIFTTIIWFTTQRILKSEND